MNTSKIIKGVVGGGRYTVTAPIVKEDYGLYLKIEGLELPATYEVDFSNDEHSGSSVTMIGNSDGVLIPHQFIDTGKDVFAFLYHVGEDFGRTVYKFRIPNKLRPDRTDEEPTPEEQSTIDQAINALNEAVEQTAQDVIDADASAQSAQGYAEQAETARDTAQTYANNAQTSANNASASASQASASATASAQSASQSAQIKADVEGMADDAQGYADSASQSATASANSASDAQGYANSASASAQSASGYASSAQGSANTASTKAQDASGYAQTASQKATEASQSATNAQGYAQTAESAKTDAQTAQGLAESARDDAIDAKTDAESARDEAQNLVDGISGKVEQIDSNTERIESLEDDIYKPYVTDSASGSIASFPDGADGIPLKSLVVDINPVQDLSNGDPSPENICPISGWEGMQLSQTGKNLFGGDAWFGRGGTEDRENRTITGGTTSSSLPFLGTLNGYPFKANTAYTLIVTMTSTATNGRPCYTFKYTDGTQTILQNNNIGTTKGTYAFVSNSEKTLYAIERASYSGTKVYYVDECGIFEGALTIDDFVPYVGQSIPISWQSEAGTVYGGKLDVLTGILVVYPYYASYNGETLTGEWISDRDVYAVGTTPTIGAQVVNIGAEGTEYQLTPYEVNSLLGQNNIWADTGDASVEYRADTKLYISRLTEPDADMIADSNIVSGQYFMVGNNLYKATANIASGSAVIVGTNATRKSLSEALNEINA